MKQLVLILAFVASAVVINAQDRYSFVTYSNEFDSKDDDAYYLVISDPVKNWYDLSEAERDDWEAEFRTSANRQIGKEFVKKYSSPLPYRGNYSAFSSSALTKEAIQEEVFRFKKMAERSAVNKPAKIIYVNLYKY